MKSLQLYRQENEVDLTFLFIFDQRSQRVYWDFAAGVINIEFQRLTNWIYIS